MSVLLVVSAQYHRSQYHGRCPDENAQWPPHPSRMYQALLSAASVAGRTGEDDAKALQFLESLPPPFIAHTPGEKDTDSTWITFAPNNNDWDGKSDPASMSRDHAELHAPTSFPTPPKLAFAWPLPEPLEGDPAMHCRRIAHIADMVDRVGTSMDDVCATAEVMPEREFLDKANSDGLTTLRPDKRGADSGGMLLGVPYPGCMDALGKALKAYTPTPRRWPKMARYQAPIEWCVYALAKQNGTPRPVLWGNTPMLALQVRERLTKTLGEGRSKSMRIMPLPSVGSMHADLNVRRFAVLREGGEADWDDVDAAFSKPLQGFGLAMLGSEQDKAQMERHYANSSREWLSATPARLQNGRRPERGKGDASGMKAAASAAVADVMHSLRLACVDAPVTSISVNAQGFAEHGLASFGKGFLQTKNTSRERRCLWHVSISFERPVKGPLVIGFNQGVGFGVMAKAS